MYVLSLGTKDRLKKASSSSILDRKRQHVPSAAEDAWQLSHGKDDKVTQYKLVMLR